MAAEASRSSTSSANSYIGSLISLTSKSEIRYEGILYNINTDESSIGLRNVRSFGSEGRKKDGPQIMPSDKVYEYILFRGSDIKDLQVKTSPLVQPTQPSQPINSDPAILQSHYPRPPAAATSNPIPDPSTHNPQLGPPGSTFPGGMPVYQPVGSMGPWGPSPPPPNVNSNSLPMPMYWPGFYGLPNGLPQLHQQPLFRPTPMQYSSFNSLLPGGAPVSNLPDFSSPLLPPSISSVSLLGSTIPSSLPPVPPSLLNTEPLPNLMQTKVPNSVGPTAPLSGSLPSVSPPTTSPDVNAATLPISNKSNMISGANVPYQGMSHPTESPTPSLVTPGQLLQSTVVSSQSSQTVHKDLTAAPALEPAPAPSSKPSIPVSVPTEAQPPILPLPTQSRNAPKTNGAPYQNRQSYSHRGRERGRGSGNSQPEMKFTEEFDFTAMNEKFNKDEVWGTLGKINKSNSKDLSDEDELEDENDSALPKIDVKPVYIKDEFFDTLSCNSNENRSFNGSTRFSDQMKLDTETFGEFSRYRGGRGPYRGGRTRGGGYHGRGYGYVNRGRGGRNPTSDY